jgi:hypothetical protein
MAAKTTNIAVKTKQQTNAKAKKAAKASTATARAKEAENASPTANDRHYGLSSSDLKSLLETAKAAKRFPNPYRGSYGGIVDALSLLGVNEPHSFKALK